MWLRLLSVVGRLPPDVLGRSTRRFQAGSLYRRTPFAFVRLEKMTGLLDDEIRKAREQANMLAEETRIISENANERGKAAGERIRKANERLQKLRPGNDN